MNLLFSLTDGQNVRACSEMHNSAVENPTIRNSRFIDGSFLRPFEERLCKRGFLSFGENQPDDYPFWFQYEQIRNRALWQTGKSLSALEHTLIWVNPIMLLERLIENSQEETQQMGAGGEMNSYLRLLGEALQQALPSLHALSVIGAELQATLSEIPLHEMTLDEIVKK
ncbi:hypothetical protein EBR25_12700 [bacterium]|nr:hypothetical protein [bacterium]